MGRVGILQLIRRNSAPAPQTALVFPSNGAAGSDIGVWFRGANLLPRVGHTALEQVYYTQQDGYYADMWHTEYGNIWEDHVDHSYDFGTHYGFPCDGTFNGNNQATGGTGSGGQVHYGELAGVVGAVDTIGDVLGTSRLATKGAWVWHARNCEYITVTTPNDTIRHRYWPDISAPTHYIEVLLAASALNIPANPVFLFGASPWRTNIPSAGRSDETSAGRRRGRKLFSAALGITDITAEAANDFNTAVTVAGIASFFYSNINPTPDDISDKSGNGHHPEWANANRPTLWEA